MHSALRQHLHNAQGSRSSLPYKLHSSSLQEVWPNEGDLLGHMGPCKSIKEVQNSYGVGNKIVYLGPCVWKALKEPTVNAWDIRDGGSIPV